MKFRKGIPLDVLADSDKMGAYQENFISSVESTVTGLQPEDALIAMDSMEFSYINNGNVTVSDEWKVLQGLTDAKMSTGTKAPPSVLGHGSGSQNIASSESLLFLKFAEGSQIKVNSIISRALTLGVRLLGQDVYIQFAFADIDLRPVSELESFRAMKQSRILEQLSIGLISDEEAAIALTGRLPTSGAQKLSGTFFKAGSTDPSANPYSNTGATNGGPQDMRPSTPTQTKGPAAKPAESKPTNLKQVK